MNTRNALLSTAFGSLFALGLMNTTAQAGPVAVDEASSEKCYGIAKAGKNDCASLGHACAGQSKTASSKEWVKVPKGTCERIVGGSATPK